MAAEAFSRFVVSLKRQAVMILDMLPSNDAAVWWDREMLEERATSLLRELEVARVSILHTGSPGGYTVPANLQMMYVELVEEFYSYYAMMKLWRLLRQGRMQEVHATAEEAAGGILCPYCRQGYEEGDVVGILRCEHRFHRRCIAGDDGILRFCTVCHAPV